MEVRDIHAVLKQYWGYDAFRPVQEQIIRSVLEGRDTLALMPTGGGKSLTYQVPTMARQGLCIVVTPLIALMKDQVDRLRALHIPAVAVHSGLSPRQIDIALDNCAYGDVKFLYVAPERLSTDAFRLRVERMKVTLLAVDEAHCISQWGYDFRPSYLRIAELRRQLPGVPVLALTASATPLVAEDIMRHLDFAEPTSCAAASHVPTSPTASAAPRTRTGSCSGCCGGSKAAASSTSARARAPNSWPTCCATRASRPPPTTADWATPSGRFARRIG